VAGNVGRPLTGLDGAIAEDAWIVCELSSFQLEDIESFRPEVAVLLNLTPDHLDRHGDLDAYRAAKLRIFENQGANDVAVVPRGFGELPGAARRVEFAANDRLPAEPRIPGEHNRENAAAAAAAARAAGIEDGAIAEALRSFAGVPHRLEPVAEIDGVRFVNDSKVTNVASAAVALRAFADPEGAAPAAVHAILGGSEKGEDFAPLVEPVGESCAAVYLIGAAAERLAEALAPAVAAGVGLHRCDDLEDAVRLAAAAAGPGEVVLLSPACASFDSFENFERRGDRFREIVEGLA
jgi:UDP-N-acetylmuramoylalanine--D-glutamate ligase